MVDLSQLLSQKTDSIIEQWVAAVAHDRQIPTTDQLSRVAIRDHIPYVLEALTTVLSQTANSDIETIANASLQHGLQRAEQGFEPTEIAREYHLLRTIIFSNLRDGLLQGTTEEAWRAFSLVNAVVDAAVAECFRSYVDQRLQELDQLQHQLTLTNQELNRLLRMSQENLSHLAHELKTPLTSIIGYSELFLRQQRQVEVKDAVPNLEHIERVLRNGRQLLGLINDALELSRYDAGELKLRLIPTDVCAVIQTVIELIQPLAVSRGLELRVDDQQAPQQVLTDPLRLQQIILNLGSNAVRYTETGSIMIGCTALGDTQWVLTVADTGIGIAPEIQEQIFEPFFRGNALEQAQLPDSTGLGLAIVHRLVKLLQGEISFTSAMGMGTTFQVVFPLKIDG
jgi:signal transduction histidine kinase